MIESCWVVACVVVAVICNFFLFILVSMYCCCWLQVEFTEHIGYFAGSDGPPATYFTGEENWRSTRWIRLYDVIKDTWKKRWAWHQKGVHVHLLFKAVVVNCWYWMVCNLNFCFASGLLLSYWQDPNSKHLGTTVWDASMVFVKFLVISLSSRPSFHKLV